MGDPKSLWSPLSTPCPSNWNGNGKRCKHSPENVRLRDQMLLAASWLLLQQKVQVTNSHHAVVIRDHCYGSGVTPAPVHNRAFTKMQETVVKSFWLEFAIDVGFASSGGITLWQWFQNIPENSKHGQILRICTCSNCKIWLKTMSAVAVKITNYA